MKKSLFIALFALIVNLNGRAQSCLPNGVSFTTQAEVDNFSVNYPGCTVVEGYLNISGFDITNLNGLSNLTAVKGSLLIDGTSLANLNGLENLAEIGSTFRISVNPMLTSLSALSSLAKVGDLNIQNSSLTDLDGLNSLDTLNQVFIYNNAALQSISGLNNLTTVKDGFWVEYCLAFTSIEGLNNLKTLGRLVIRGASSMTNLDGLENLNQVGSIDLSENSALNDITALGNINSPIDLAISYCPALTNLNGLGNFTSLGHVAIYENNQLAGLGGLDNVASLKSLTLQSNPSLTSLQGLQSLQTASGSLRILYNDALANLNGLQNLKSVVADLGSIEPNDTLGLEILGNQSLNNLDGLSNLATIGNHRVKISHNPALPNCAIFTVCDHLINAPEKVHISNNAPGCNSPAEVSSFCASTAVTVEVLLDNGATCASGLPVADFPVRFEGGIQTTLKPTATDGQARFRYFDAAPFQIILPELSDEHWNVCEIRKNFVASNGGDSTLVSLFLSPKVQCPELEVKLKLPTNFRGCLVQSDLQVSVQNIGTVLAEGGKIAIVMPPVFDVLNTDPLLSGQNGDTLYFELGDLKPFEKAQVKMAVKTKCDTFLMGQTLCWEAFAAMDNPCPQTGQAYSEIKLKAECIGNALVRLSLKNIGNAPTQGWHEYRIIRNETVLYYNGFSLNAQESLSFDFPADGATWRMEATKFDDGTHTAVALENCGGLTPGLITAFWLDHGPVEYDFDCRQVVQAYDPNRKTAVPTGVGFISVISTGQPIYYTIDFQNTGTDTAFRVRLLDQLSDNLDLSTFKAEGSSHPCSWELRGEHLEVLYSPIALPDSHANLAASQGYFSFSIFPKPSLTGGDWISNNAKIIFDFNWPIWTNWVYHSIGHLTVSVDEAQAQTKRWKVLGNPTRDVAIFRAETFVAGEKRFELFDAAGRVLRSARFSGQEFDFQRDMLPEGLYFFRISDAQHRVFTGKIVVAD